MNRTHFIALALASPLLGAAPARGHMITTRDSGCSCCESWVALARNAGYRVDLHDLDRDERIRRFGLTEATAGCHTTQIDGYLIEGHVPLDVVARLLRERPKTRGIGIAGMPTGLAGMGGPKAGATVTTLDAHPRTFARV